MVGLLWGATVALACQWLVLATWHVDADALSKHYACSNIADVLSKWLLVHWHIALVPLQGLYRAGGGTSGCLFESRRSDFQQSIAGSTSGHTNGQYKDGISDVRSWRQGVLRRQLCGFSADDLLLGRFALLRHEQRRYGTSGADLLLLVI